jgi:hypothetical protein
MLMKCLGQMHEREEGTGESIFFFYHKKERGKESWLEH